MSSEIKTGKELLGASVMLVFCFIGLYFCINSIINRYNEEQAKQFIAACEFNGGTVRKDSYGSLHCVSPLFIFGENYE